MTRDYQTRTCPGCGILFVVEVEQRLVCLTTHPTGTCCHAGQWIACDDGMVIRAVRSQDCRIVDVFPDQDDVQRLPVFVPIACEPNVSEW